MTKVHTNNRLARANSRRHSNLNQNSQSLFSFSRILETRYQGRRVPPATAPTTPNNWDNSLTTSTTVINLEEQNVKSSSMQPKRNQATSITGLPQSEELHSKESNVRRRRIRHLRPFLWMLFGMALLLGIAVLIFVIVYKSKTSATITTTVMTTTYTTATTTTSTTLALTSTSTTSTSAASTIATSSITTSGSTTPTTTDSTTTTSCYFGGDYVNLAEGGQRQISSLKVGDRVWTLSDDGQQLIEDEIMCIPHAGPTTLTEFYTFITIEGQTVSLTGAHYIIIAANNERGMKTTPASSVTLRDRLIMLGRPISLKSIVYSKRIGYYSPITLSGYLLVNNLSTSVYVDFLSGTHEFFHQLTGPARIYYHVMRWFFGNDYIPFSSSVNDEIHPISIFVIDNYERI